MGEVAHGSLSASAGCKKAIAEGVGVTILCDRWHLAECLGLEESPIATGVTEFPLHWRAEGGGFMSSALV